MSIFIKNTRNGFENPLMGTVANTPPESITVVFRDDSPEDNHGTVTVFSGYDPTLHGDNIQGGVGAAFKTMEVTIVTQALEELTPEDIEEGVEPKALPSETITETLDGSNVIAMPVGGLPSDIRDSEDGDGWKIVDGFNKMKVVLVFVDPDGAPSPDVAQLLSEGAYQIDVDPRTVQSVTFEMVVAGDYNIAVIGNSPANKAESDPEIQEWIKTEDGHIQMPYRDIIEAPGNYGQSSDYTSNRASLKDKPSEWTGEGRPRKVRYQYGAARAALLYGLDLEGTIGNVFVRAHYSINGKYKQYPTIPKEKIGFSRLKTTILSEDGEEETGISIDPATGLPLDANGVPTYSETEGERFEAMLGGEGTDESGDGTMGRETAWFVQLKSRFGKLYLEGVYYHIDPGYTTNLSQLRF